MNSSNQASRPGSATSESSISGLLLSVSTAPLLVALVGAKALAVAVREFGELTEEVFRGDRLPLLDPPPASTSNAPKSESL